VKIKVAEPFRLVHNGEVFNGGDVLDVDDDDADNRANEWIAAGWAEVVDDKPPAKAVPGKATPRKARSG
jgi:hypothetical protein